MKQLKATTPLVWLLSANKGRLLILSRAFNKQEQLLLLTTTGTGVALTTEIPSLPEGWSLELHTLSRSLTPFKTMSPHALGLTVTSLVWSFPHSEKEAGG